MKEKYNFFQCTVAPGLFTAIRSNKGSSLNKSRLGKYAEGRKPKGKIRFCRNEKVFLKTFSIYKSSRK